MSDLRTSVVINLTGNLARRARKNASALEAMGRRGKASLWGLNSATSAVSSGLKRAGGRFTALFAGVSLVAAGKQIIDFDQKLASIGSRAGHTGKDLDTFVNQTKEKFFKLAQLPDFKINPSEILAAVDKIITKTGDMKLAMENLPNIALLIRGGEATGEDAGGLIADLSQKLRIKGTKEMAGALGDLTAGGDIGSFEISDMSAQGERLTRSRQKVCKSSGSYLPILLA